MNTNIKRGNKVFIIRGNDVEPGVVSSINDEGFRVRWGSDVWGGIDTVHSRDLFRSEADACGELACRLQTLVDALRSRSQRIATA